MATSGLSGALPAGNVPFTDQNGVLTPYGRNLLNALIQRTGGAPGANVDAEIAALGLAVAAAQASANASLKKAANLSDLSNLVTALTNLQLVLQTGWSTPTGGDGSRAAIDTTFAQVIGSAYNQAAIQALSTQVTALSQGLGQLIIDLEAFKAIGP